VAVLRDGSLIVADDAGGRIWRVRRSAPDEGP
jgi:glucose/arabinose dehydrogenase